jgi:hydrogenase maturation protease
MRRARRPDLGEAPRANRRRGALLVKDRSLKHSPLGTRHSPLGDLLVLGFGNPGRLDDGLGPALAEAVEALGLPGVTAEASYQLTVEDAAEVARHPVVLFADADVAGPEPFWVQRLHAGVPPLSFSSHAVEPQAVVSLAKSLFHAEPDAYVMGIRGYQFNEFGEYLSPKAHENLAAAIAFVHAAIQSGAFQEVRPPAAEGPSPVHETTRDDH